MPKKIRFTKPKAEPIGFMPEVVDPRHREWKVTRGDKTTVDARKAEATVSDDRYENLAASVKARVSLPGLDKLALNVDLDPRNVQVFENQRTTAITKDLANELGVEYSYPRYDPDEAEKQYLAGDLQAALRADPTFDPSDAYYQLAYRDDKDGDAQWQADCMDEYQEYKRHREAAIAYLHGHQDDPLAALGAAAISEMLPTSRHARQRQQGEGEQSFEQMVKDGADSIDGYPGRRRGPGDAGKEALAALDEKLGELGMKPKVGPVGDSNDLSWGTGNTLVGEVDDEVEKFVAMDNPAWWGKVTWKHPRLSRNTKLKKAARKAKPTDMGVIPVNVHRWTTDQRIFTVKKKDKGGTLLLDMSGSMSWTAEQIDAIIDEAPYSKVVGYSGAGGKGVIAVFCDKGRRVADTDIRRYAPGGNEIDGPALRWLATQPEPRVWVSDGYACSSMAEAETADLINVCRGLCRKHRILRLATMDKAIEFFRRIR